MHLHGVDNILHAIDLVDYDFGVELLLCGLQYDAEEVLRTLDEVGVLPGGLAVLTDIVDEGHEALGCCSSDALIGRE